MKNFDFSRILPSHSLQLAAVLLAAAALLAATALFMPMVASAQSPAVAGASSGIGVGDAVPAATLLLPYFEVDLEDADGANTRFWIHNANSAPELVNVVVWTDMTRPTLAFNIYLSGFDVAEVDMGALFRTGVGPSSYDPARATGPFSMANASFPGCSFPLQPTLPSSFRDFLAAAHSGAPAPAGFPETGLCGGANWGGGSARGFVTVDVVNECTVGTTPLDEGYFADGGTGIAANRNSLFGEYVMTNIDGIENAHGDKLVHIEAAGSVAGGFWESGDYTFYGKALAASAVDNREPLATTWLVRYENDVMPEIQESSFLLYWRDTFGSNTDFFDCQGVTPSPFPMAATQQVIFDDTESVVIAEDHPFSPPFPGNAAALMQWASGRVPMDQMFGVFDQGWALFNLNTTSAGVPLNPYSQNHISVVYRGWSDFVHAGTGAVAFDNALVPWEAHLQ